MNSMALVNVYPRSKKIIDNLDKQIVMIALIR